MKKMTPSFLILAMWMLISGDYLFCAIKMAGKQEFLTSGEVAFYEHLAVFFATIFLFFALLSMTKKENHPLFRVVKSFAALLPVLLTAEIMGLFYPKLLLMEGASTIKSWYMMRFIAMGVAAFVATAVIFAAVNDVIRDEKRGGVLKGLLRLITHPLHFFVFTLLMVATVIMSGIMRIMIVTFRVFEFRFSFATNMMMYLIESILSAAVLYGLFCFMKKSICKWESRADKRKEKKNQTSEGEMPNQIMPNQVMPNPMMSNQPMANPMMPNQPMNPMMMNQQMLAKEPSKLKKQFAAGFSVANYIVSAIIFVACIVLLFPLLKSDDYDNTDALLDDIKYSIAYSNGNLLSGKLSLSYEYAKEAQRKVEACRAFAEEDDGTLQDLVEDYPEDVFTWILYIKATGDIQKLEKYVIEVNPTADDLKMLLFEEYGRIGDDALSEQQRGYREEYLRECIDTFSFESLLIDPVSSAEEMKSINKIIDKRYANLDLYTRNIEYLCDIGKNGEVKDVYSILDEADEYPEDVTIQYLAAVIAASGVSDGSGYLDRGKEVVARFVALSEADISLSEEQQNIRKQKAVELLIKFRGYSEAVELLEKTKTVKGSDEEKELGLLKLYCADCSGDEKTCYLTAKKLLEEGVTNPHVYYFYGLGALKSEKQDQMTQSLQQVSKMIQDESLTGDDLLQSETVFYTMMEYAVLNDSATWTDYEYGYYKNMEEEDKKKLDSFLYNFMEAMNAYFNTRDYDVALEMINKVLDIRDDLSYAYYLKGAILYSQREFEKSAESYNNALKTNPDHPIILYALANTYDAMENYSAAYEASGKVQKMLPTINHEQDWYGLGVHNKNLFRGLSSMQGGDE